MPLSAIEIERIERTLRRTIIKRDANVNNMRLLYDLAQKVESNGDVLPLFRARKRDLETILSNFHTEQDAIIDMLIELNRDQEYHSKHAAIETTISEQYYFIISIADVVIKDETPPVQLPNTESLNIQLPKIQLPHFDGDILKWCTFRDTFKSLVHDNSSLSNIERFHYLISAVSDSASAVVRSVPLSNANYEVAWSALNERFDNERLIMNAHLDKLFNFPPLKSPSLTELKSFLDTFKENIAALSSFEIPDKLGFLLFYVASRALDSNTKCLFESQHKTKIPVIGDLLTFIQARCQVLQNSFCSSTSILSTKNKLITPPKKTTPVRTTLFTASSESTKSCPMCQNSHNIYKCEKFQQLSTNKRLKFIQLNRMCTNCLSRSHTSSKCNSKYTCRHCSARHHSLLHLEAMEKKPPTSSGSNCDFQTSDTASSTSSADTASSSFVGTASCTNLCVLGTAVIRIYDKFGQWIPVRALIDSGSQISAITHTCATRLGLTRRQTNVAVVGLSQCSIPQTKGTTTCSFVPHCSFDPKLTCELLILSIITGMMPSSPLNANIRSKYIDLTFADPSFDVPGRIDFLLGADLYNLIFLNGYRVRHNPDFPSAFETALGWIVVGTASQPISSSQQVSLALLSEPSLNQLLHRFWKIEEPVFISEPFTENQKCEDIFSRCTTRDNFGRYIVAFPFKTNPSALGDSKSMALSRFFNLERKLQSEPSLYAAYREFMQEYIALGHMKIATTPAKYIIPHHAVVKQVNNKFKLRVVFDASARTSSGASLNNLLFTGPKLQCDIMDLLMRCRVHRYMFMADICKMYRQINISAEQCAYQHILWRNDPSETLQEYTLSTVTYGVVSSPFQAIRVLHQLEKDEGDQYPAAKRILSTQTYVDDIITGGDTVDKALLLQKQVTQLLSRGGFALKKWASNCTEILQNVPVEDRITTLSFDPKDECSVKILGLHWDPLLDVFSYHSDPFTSVPTKRSILSAVAKIYDPLGTLAPITFWAKCFMQVLWKNGYGWDNQICEKLSSSWKLYSMELSCVSSIRIPRHIPIDQCCDAQLIGFSDASLKGFAAVVYIRLSYASKPTTVHLITAKSKVAPLKSGNVDETLSVPRLELCGALLLAQILSRVRQTFGPLLKLSSIHAWTDSTVVLSWLTTSQIEYKVFVTNRLNKISELVPCCNWHHIPSSLNPADCVSRGMFPKEALSHVLYWEGPDFLKKPVHCWPSDSFQIIPPDSLPERKPSTSTVHVVTMSKMDLDWLKRFSSLTRLERTIAQMLRFINRTRRLSSFSGFIRRAELNDALKIVIRLTQAHEFQEVLKCLSSSTDSVAHRSIARLMPFIDNEGLIRVGGRLRHSSATEDFKHPILLPKSCILSSLLISHYHIQNLHAGPQLVASLLSARFWILSSRSIIRHIIFKCVTCAKHRASIVCPIMGDLPSSRVCPSYPFHKVGIDYAGPLLYKEGKRRNARTTKCYLVIFICMAVKAVHIEVVSDLTTSAFIAALHRFVSRRGVPAHIFSDCGTNFKGADSALRSLLEDPVAQNLFSNSVPCQWHFNPPAAPHFGGLWEAAVKSTKFHFKRAIGHQLLTYEEICTLTSRIEAILNSRPIIPQSTDPNDLRALTPGDFLIGRPLVAVPEPDLTKTPTNRLSRWKLINQVHQSFWKRWSVEYLTTLQGRAKWYRKHTNLAVNDLVLVHVPNAPPTSWKLGRVELIHPGEDGVVRVVTVRTKDGVYKRPVVKLAVLPVTDVTDPKIS